MSEPDYVVMRAGLDLPEGWMPDDLDGRWYDRAEMPMGPPPSHDAGPKPGTAYAVPSGRFETRDDGAVAEVWEVQMWPAHRAERGL